jgi:hypothetical protein
VVAIETRYERDCTWPEKGAEGIFHVSTRYRKRIKREQRATVDISYSLGILVFFFSPQDKGIVSPKRHYNIFGDKAEVLGASENFMTVKSYLAFHMRAGVEAIKHGSSKLQGSFSSPLKFSRSYHRGFLFLFLLLSRENERVIIFGSIRAGT